MRAWDTKAALHLGCCAVATWVHVAVASCGSITGLAQGGVWHRCISSQRDQGRSRSGDGSLENVGTKLDAPIQCHHCRQRFMDQRALELHLKFVRAISIAF